MATKTSPQEAAYRKIDRMLLGNAQVQAKRKNFVEKKSANKMAKRVPGKKGPSQRGSGTPVATRRPSTARIGNIAGRAFNKIKLKRL
jgi:hypothetical protein